VNIVEWEAIVLFCKEICYEGSVGADRTVVKHIACVNDGVDIQRVRLLEHRLEALTCIKLVALFDLSVCVRWR
jgi:hypothetical protein